MGELTWSVRVEMAGNKKKKKIFVVTAEKDSTWAKCKI